MFVITDLVNQLAAWLGTTSANAFMQDNYWIVPIVQSVHILCISILFASMAMLDLRMLGLAGTHQSLGDMGRRFLPWTWWALVVLVITGAFLTASEPLRELQSFYFGIKMIMLVCVGVITLLFHVVLMNNPSFWERNGGAAKLVGAVSLALWVAIVICGRWIAYGAHG